MVLSGCDSDGDDSSMLMVDDFVDVESLELSAAASRRAKREIEQERRIAQRDWLDLVKGPQLDLLEVCAPWDSPLVQAIREAGGRALAIGVHNGFDLSTREGFLRAAALLRDCKPKYVHISPPCYPWSILQNANQRNPQQVRDLQEKQRVSRKLLRHCCKLVEIQRQEGGRDAGLCQGDSVTGHAGGEQPLTAQSWRLPEFRRMVQLCGGERFSVFGCTHGLRGGVEGKLRKKPWGWFSSSPGLKAALAIPCVHQSAEHEPVQGGQKAPQSASYPFLLCQRFAKVLLRNMYQGDYIKDCAWTPSKSSSVFVGDSEDVAVDDGAILDPEEDMPAEPEDHFPEDGFRWDPGIKRKLTLAHRNLGHPSKEAFLKLLRDAGADASILDQAAHFDCPECRQRGRRATLRPATLPHYTHKWQCMSIDTFGGTLLEKRCNQDRSQTTCYA